MKTDSTFFMATRIPHFSWPLPVTLLRVWNGSSTRNLLSCYIYSLLGRLLLRVYRWESTDCWTVLSLQRHYMYMLQIEAIHLNKLLPAWTSTFISFINIKKSFYDLPGHVYIFSNPAADYSNFRGHTGLIHVPGLRTYGMVEILWWYNYNWPIFKALQAFCHFQSHIPAYRT